MDTKASFEELLIGNRQDTPYETRIINVITLVICLVSVFKIVLNATILNAGEAIVAACFALVSLCCYLYVRRTSRWKNLAWPVCGVLLCIITFDWAIDPLGVLSDDGYNLIILGVIAAVILKPKQILPFSVMLCMVIVYVLVKGLHLPDKSLFDGRRMTTQMIITGVTLLLFLIALITIIRIVILEHRRVLKEMELAREQIKILKGLLPICTKCKKIRDDTGDWKRLEVYITSNSEASFSHTYCPECSEELLSDFYHFQRAGNDRPDDL